MSKSKYDNTTMADQLRAWVRQLDSVGATNEMLMRGVIAGIANSRVIEVGP